MDHNKYIQRARSISNICTASNSQLNVSLIYMYIYTKQTNVAVRLYPVDVCRLPGLGWPWFPSFCREMLVSDRDRFSCC